MLRNPMLVASNRSKLLELATSRANELTVVARARLATVQTDALVRVQDLRKATARALQTLATRVEPCSTTPAESRGTAVKAPKSPKSHA